MSFSAILLKSASTLVPLATRIARVQRTHHRAIFTALNHRTNVPQKLSPNPSVPLRSYSLAKSDESLLGVVESEIKYALESSDHGRVEDIPDGFPFEIQDDPGMQTITLTREYQGQTIKVEVNMPELVDGENFEDYDAGDDEKAGQFCTALVVTVSKPGNPSLVFNCTSFADEIGIDSLAVKNHENNEDQLAYEGPYFQDLDENLQKAFHKFLEIRGIKPSITNFLHEYMINKDSREYLLWLKHIKSFIQAQTS